MTMKLPRKLLSCLLVLAICITTVFGCLMTVSAAAASYAFGEGSVNEELTEAAINVTLTPPTDVATLANGTYMAEFMLNEVDTDGLVLQSVAVEAIAPNSIPLDTIGLSYNSEDLADGEIAYIELDCNAAFTSVTLKLTFGFSGGTAVKGNEYKMSIDSVTYTGRYEGETYTETASATGVIKTGCDHIITIDDQSVLVNTDSVNGYSVYTNSVCSVCGERFDYQVIPTAVPSDEKVIYWDGSVTSVSSFDELGGKGTSDEPYIIDSAADLALIAGATINSANLYFKVADGIDAIVLQSESVGAGILELTSASAVKDYFEDTSKTGFVEWVRGGWSTATPFIGSFDGNGVEIYGLYANTPNDTNPLAGLFTQIDAGAAISNVTVKNSYINSKSFAAFIAPYSGSDKQGLMTTGTVSFSQCIVANCYMVSNVDNSTNKAGIMTGTMNDYINMSNCLVYGNDANNVAVPYKDDSSIKGFKISLVGDLENVKDPVDSITNCICLGATPYPQYNVGYNNFVVPNASMFSNVYTDQPTEDISLYIYEGAAYRYYNKANQVIADSLTSVTATQVKTQDFVTTFNTNAGTEVLAVDVNGGYPTFAKDVAKPGSTGIVETWGDTKSTLTGETTVHETTGTAEPRWYDNTFELLDPSNAENSETNPYIIDSAEGLAWLATKATAAETTGKWYKVADGIKAFNMNTKVDMSGDMTAAEVEAALNTTCQMKTWWGGNFAGSFDGNGVTIYGVQGYNTTYGGSGGLFGTVTAGTTLKNFTLKNSYFYGDAVGSLFNAGDGTGIITMEGIVLTGNVLVSYRNNGAESFGGVLFGRAGSNRVDVKNCLAYNNIAKHQGFYTTGSGYEKTGYDVTYGFIGNASKVNEVNPRVENTIILDCLPYTAQYSYSSSSQVEWINVYTNMTDVEVTNTMINGDTADTVYTTHYTSGVISQGDGKYKLVVELGNYQNSGETKDLSGTVGVGSFYPITANDITGLAASSVVKDLNTENGSDVWAATANGYPTPMAAYADTINSVSSIDLALKAVNLTYNNDGSFNLNFHYEPAYSGFAPQLYVAQADLSGFILNPTKSPYAGEGLSTEALMYTIENLSAREIGDTLLPTVVAANVNQALWGKTEQMSIADYAVAVINGEGYYTDTTDETIIQQDKNVAAAVINYGNAAKAALSQGYDGNAAGGKTIYWDGSKTAPTEQVDGTYIINTAEELAYVAYSATTGNYKIADDIGTIIMQPKATIEAAGGASKLMSLSSYEETKTYFEDLKEKSADLKPWGVKASNTNPFGGTFDGNGVEIYGLYYNNVDAWQCAALFPSVAYNATIKNVAVKSSYLVASNYSGALIGYVNGTINSVNYNGTMHIENCVIANNYIGAGHNSYRAGVMLGGVQGTVNVTVTADDGTETIVREAFVGVSVENCLVYGNIAYSKLSATAAESGIFGSPANHNQNEETTYGCDNQIENSIILDCTPYVVDGGNNISRPENFNKVYTNDIDPLPGTAVNVPSWLGASTTEEAWAIYTSKNKINVLDNAVLATGSAAVANMPNLDWSKWAYGMSGEYPTPITSAVASDEKVISCYSGTPATAFSDTAHDGSSAENAIIISSADELAYLANGADGLTAGKYYAIDPSIDAMVLQPSDYAEDIMALDSASAVKNYFENTAPSGAKKGWATSATSTTNFGGTLNGNGVTIYGMYSTTYNVYGLFPYASNITLENIAIKNNYVYGDKAGVIVGYATTAGTITLNNCEVANNVAIVSRFNDGMSYGGVLIGYVVDPTTYTNTFLTVDNCVIYGNIATHTESVTSNGVTATYDTNYGLYGNVKGNSADPAATKISNSIILDTLPFGHNSIVANAFNNGTFSNVYTNMLGQTYVNTNYNQGVKTYILSSTVNDDGTVVISSGGESTKDRTLAAGSLISISAADVMGDNAKTKAPSLGWADNGGVWYTGNAWGHPSLIENTSVMPTANQMAYDALTMTNYDEYTHTDPYFSMYATSLNLKTNPYIAFTFAFAGGTPDYKANRDNITVTFKTASETITTKVGNGNGGLSDGWTNNEGAGRYHLYRLTGISVEDLCKDITVTVNYSGTDYTFGTFSAEGFALDIQNAYKQDPCQYYATRVEAAKALLYYTQMINARYGSIA